MAKVEVSGFPEKVKLHSLVDHLQKILAKDGIKKFWIREMSDVRGTDTKMANIEFNSSYEANIAQRRLDGFLFIYQYGTRYPLTARHETRRSPSPRYEGRNWRHGHSSDRLRSRSRSPMPRRNQYHSETSRLDMELELLRKQRQVIEEERRLLMERKKLELIKDLGPNATSELDFNDGWEQDFRRDAEQDFRRAPGSAFRSNADQNFRRAPGQVFRREPEQNFRREYRREVIHDRERIMERQKSYQRSSPNAEIDHTSRKRTRKMPMFIVPCTQILTEMEGLISSVTVNDEMARKLRNGARTTIRKRMIVALENKEHMNSSQIVLLYRKLYPLATDEILIKKLAAGLSQTCEIKSEDAWARLDDEDYMSKMDDKADAYIPPALPKNDILEDIPTDTNEVNYDATSDSMDAAVSLMCEGDSNWIDADLEN